VSPPVSPTVPGGNRDTTFRALLRFGVWSVTRNNVFYGDYLDRDQAIRSACYGARAVEALLPGDVLIPHYDGAIAP
jgi:hypothetical protein